MKLVLYSGGTEKENIELNKLALKLTGVKSPRLTLIPSSSYDSELDFNLFVKEFSALGVTKFLHFPVDVPFSKTLLNEVYKSDLIFLGGGNTFYFLKHLKRAGVLPFLKDFAASGKVLCGLSAGAIIMTPNIRMAEIPDFDRDENSESLTNLKALKLVNFEFFPHYKNSKRYEEELRAYSLGLNYPIYACSDGGGVIVEEGRLSFVGKTHQFFQGKKIKLHNALT